MVLILKSIDRAFHFSHITCLNTKQGHLLVESKLLIFYFLKGLPLLETRPHLSPGSRRAVLRLEFPIWPSTFMTESPMTSPSSNDSTPFQDNPMRRRRASTNASSGVIFSTSPTFPSFWPVDVRLRIALRYFYNLHFRCYLHLQTFA